MVRREVEEIDDYCEDDFFNEEYYTSVYFGEMEIEDVIQKLSNIQKDLKGYNPILGEPIGDVGVLYHIPLTIKEARKKVSKFVKRDDKRQYLLEKLKEIEKEIESRCGDLVKRKEEIKRELGLLEGE